MDKPLVTPEEVDAAVTEAIAKATKRGKPPKHPKKTKPGPCEDWRASCIVNDRGQIVTNLANLMMALRADPVFAGAFAFN